MIDINYIQAGLGNTTFAFIILLGILVAIHEFGHFIVAKWCKMQVVEFAIGMGKKLFSFTKGETTYSIRMLPLGGFVNITGQDPQQEVPKEIEHRTFRSKPIWQRAAVVIAGPLFNFILTFLIFVMLFGLGVPTQSPSLEFVTNNSPAYAAGFRTKDLISKIVTEDGKSIDIKDARDLELAVGNNGNQQLKFHVNRNSENLVIPYSPPIKETTDSALRIKKTRGVIEGVENYSLKPILISFNKDSFLKTKLKLPPYFKATKAEFATKGNQEFIVKNFSIQNFPELEAFWQAAYMQSLNSEDMNIKILGYTLDSNMQVAENAKTEILQYNLPANSSLPKTIKIAGAVNSDLVIGNVMKGLSAEKIGLKKGDVILSLDNKTFLSREKFIGYVKNIKLDENQSTDKMKISWLREGQIFNGEVQPIFKKTTDPLTQQSEKRFLVGVQFNPQINDQSRSTIKAKGIIEAITLGWDKTIKISKLMGESILNLIKGNVSAKTLAGPIAIAQIAGKSFEQGYSAFLTMMAFLSLNLCFLNLLPLPVLDGGHLLLFAVEAITRRKPNPKFIQVWSMIGVFLLISLMLFSTYNDISRILKNFFS